jgi:hypothetical protein
MRRVLLAAAIGMVTLLVGLSGVSEAKEGRTYYGTVPGTDDAIGIEVLGNNPSRWAGAFLCNDERIESFSGEPIKANRLDLTSADGSGVRIKAVVSKKRVHGTVRLAGDATASFTASRTKDSGSPILRCPTLAGSS